MLEISLLGAFEVKREGRSLCTHWVRQSHRLLALLTLNHNRAVRTDWIPTALLLEESALPQALTELYRVLGPTDRDRIRHANRQVYFDTSGVSVDLFEFERLIARNTPETLEQAVKIHRGGLLKDWPEEGWFYEEREESLTAYLDAIKTLTDAALKAQDYDRAASFLRRFVNAYPEMDGAWTRLVEALGKAGNREEVERVQQRYLDALQQRSNAEGRVISPSTRFLVACEQARRDELSSLTAAPVGVAVPAPMPRSPQDDNELWEPVGGAMPLDSPFYLTRPADAQASEALNRGVSFLLVKGARQVGKSSLLARLLRQARESGARVVRSDWQKVPHASLESDRLFLREQAETFVDYLDLDADPNARFDPALGGITGFERFLKRDVLPTVNGPLVWVIDEADRLFDLPFRDDIFAMLRSWHGERASDFTGRWQKLTVVLAYATEAFLFIRDMNQSPFNIGVRVELADFTREQVGEMNRRYGGPLREEAQIDRLFALVGGHPYLVRRSLQEMRQHDRTIADIEAGVECGDSLFNDHLARLRLALQRDPEMETALRAYLREGGQPDLDRFVRLRASGVMQGDSPPEMRPRCRLYDLYLRQAFA